MAKNFIETMKEVNAAPLIQNETDISEIKWKQLCKLDYVVPVPFKLTLDNEENSLICHEVVRVIPGKRLVAFGKWDNQDVVAKIFYGSSKATRNVEQEISGVEKLNAAGILTPKILWYGSAQKQKIKIILFERIMDSITLDSLWRVRRNNQELFPLIREIAVELATQHVLGIVQNDLHMKNFLITPEHIYTLDGSNISSYPEVLPKKQSLVHLALFLAQLGLGSENLQEEFFQTYVKARSWIIRPSDLKLLHESLKNWHRKRWQGFEKKIKRNSTAFAHQKTFDANIMYDRNYFSPELANFFKDPDVIFEHKNTQILKDGRTSTVARVIIDNRAFVVKRYNIKDNWHLLRRCLRETRAASTWRLAQCLCLFGIPTAKPIAYIEKQFLGFRGSSYILMEYVDAPHVGQYYTHYRNNSHRFKIVAERIVAIFKNLSKLRLTHGDLKMTNILIDNDQPILIDLDGMTEHSTHFGLNQAFKKEMQRFMRNWEDYPDVYEMFHKMI